MFGHSEKDMGGISPNVSKTLGFRNTMTGRSTLGA